MTPSREEPGRVAPMASARTLLVRAVLAGGLIAVACALIGRFEFDSEWLYVPWGFGLVVGLALTVVGLAMWGVARLALGAGHEAGRASLGRFFALVGAGALTVFLLLSALGLVQGEKLF